MNADDQAWAEWFDSQYELTDRIRRAIDGLTAGKSDAFKVALCSAVIESTAERMRQWITLDAS